jgi:hypothetical protein
VSILKCFHCPRNPRKIDTITNWVRSLNQEEVKEEEKRQNQNSEEEVEEAEFRRK